jgi:hypothetical protein
MDERDSHVDDELETDIEDDEDDSTPADTEESDEPKTPAEKARADQKKKWLDEIKSGKKTLDDMPDNLGWLRKDIEPELESNKEPDNVDQRVKAILRQEREKEDLTLLIEDLEENASQAQLAEFKTEYEQLVADGASPLRATITARRLVGLQDSRSVVKERRKKGMLIPPSNSRPRDTVESTEQESATEKALNADLPPGFSPK